jgi:hypothetical protein
MGLSIVFVVALAAVIVLLIGASYQNSATPRRARPDHSGGDTPMPFFAGDTSSSDCADGGGADAGGGCGGDGGGGGGGD